MQRLYYFGPELTFSHEAAGRLRQQQAAWSKAELVAQPSTDALFEAVINDPQGGAAAPVYNHIQGDVIDFLRFFLLDQLAEVDLSLSYGLFSHRETLEDIKRIYTKDTVVPQVSRWVAELPDHIDLVSSLEMSTADAAARAAADPSGGAICGPAAGQANDLNLLTLIAADQPGNFTRFGMFSRPPGWWDVPRPFLERFEHPLCFDDHVWREIRRGQKTFYWSVPLHDHSHIHLDHLSLLLTLRKMAGWGNRVVILLDRGQVDDHTLYNYWNGLLAVMGQRPTEIEVGGRPQKGWIQVDSIEKVRTIKVSGRTALLIDPVPGIDGYAKMSARRNNTISWPIRPEEVEAYPFVAQIVARYFAPERLAAAGFDWTWGAH